jgi:predicted HTH transcriptional regulator
MSVIKTFESTIANAVRVNAENIGKVIATAVLGQLPDSWYETLNNLNNKRVKPASNVTPFPTQAQREKTKNVTTLRMRESASVAILDFLNMNEKASVRDLMKITGQTKGTVGRLLTRLLNEQRITRHGHGTATHYKKKQAA